MNNINLITSYFPDLSLLQIQQFTQLQTVYEEWNGKINVISRKDMDSLYEKHILHSLGIAKVMEFRAETEVMDVGTGGGFPGIPLAILFPDSSFHLVDSIGKKIKVVQEVSTALGLQNVTYTHTRVEEVKHKYDFIVSRAVTAFPAFHSWVRNSFKKLNKNRLPNGILYLKGGNLAEEFKGFDKAKFYNLSDYFEGEFFETKKVVYYPAF